MIFFKTQRADRDGCADTSRRAVRENVLPEREIQKVRRRVLRQLSARFAAAGIKFDLSEKPSCS